MRVYSGTSGYSYKEWKGSFYPDTIKAEDMLRFYSERLPAVEINNTFYRMPKSALMERWAEQVPDTFRFVIKGSRRITHQSKLQDPGESLGFLWRSIQKLGDRLGPVFFQLPKWLRKDVDLLREFFDATGDHYRVVLEFQHRTWHDDTVYDLLKEKGATFVFADEDGSPDDASPDDGAKCPLPATADWGYVRMRRAQYSEEDLARWRERLRETGWREAFVFFKHEDCSGPELAARFQAMFQE